MRKKRINEEQLLADAKNWFEKKYLKTPKECSVEFIKVWYKPTPLGKITACVFAPTKEIGEAFIWEQNAILRAMKSFGLVVLGLFIVGFIFLYDCAQNDMENAMTMGGIGVFICFCACLSFYYLARKCKRLEKIHKWNVEIYYPQ